MMPIVLFFLSYTKKFFIKYPPQSNERVVTFVSTNQVSESSNQTMAQYGKSKTKEKHPIINTALFVDEKTPLLPCFIYAGRVATVLLGNPVHVMILYNDKLTQDYVRYFDYLWQQTK